MPRLETCILSFLAVLEHQLRDSQILAEVCLWNLMLELTDIWVTSLCLECEEDSNETSDDV